MMYAYGRVSAADQNLNRQIDSFLAYGVKEKQIYTDKKSGKDFERENYKRMKKKLSCGDLLISTKGTSESGLFLSRLRNRYL